MKETQDPLSLFEILQMLWGAKRKIAAALALVYFVAIIFIFFSDKQYETQLVISPIEDGKNAQIGNLLKVITGNEGTSGTQSGAMAEFMHLLTSATAGEVLIKDERISQTIFAREWDPSEKVWHAPRGIFPRVKAAVRWLLRYPGYAPPTGYTLSAYLQKAIKVVPIKSSPMVEVKFYNVDPRFSEYLLEKMFAASDKFLRQQKIERVYKTLAHLNKRLETVENVVHRKSLSDLLLYYEQELMLLETDQPFAARKLGEVRSSNSSVSPKLMTVFILSTLIGLLLGSVRVLLLRKIRAA